MHRATPASGNGWFAIKAEVIDLQAKAFSFAGQKTMYGGKLIAEGDTLFIFASENEGGPGLVARGNVTAASALARKPGIARQTPRLTLAELKAHSEWSDGKPETELNFKLYRQATNKIVGLSAEAAAFLRTFF